MESHIDKSHIWWIISIILYALLSTQKFKSPFSLKGFFESTVFIPKPEAKRWRIEVAVSADIQPKGLACGGTGVCHYMGEDPTGTKSENPTFNITGCEKTAKIIYDGRECINGKDVIWKKND